MDEKSSFCEEWADGRDSHGLILLKNLYKFLVSIMIDIIIVIT